MRKEYYRIECEGGFEDIQLETLRDNQLNIASFSVPIGIETDFDMKCKTFKVVEEGNKVEKEEIGFVNYNVGIDEAKLHVNVEVSDFDLLKEILPWR